MVNPGDPLRMFLLGVVGSVAVEAWDIHRAFVSGRPLPARYYKTLYWVVRGIIALTGGVLAWAYHMQGERADLLAINIGASASALLSTFTRPEAGNMERQDRSGTIRPASSISQD
jgi:hypothetical protein